MPQGRIYTRGTTLIISQKREITLGLLAESQPITGHPCLITNQQAFTRPTQEPDHPDQMHRLTPTAGSLRHYERDEFSINVFSI